MSSSARNVLLELKDTSVFQQGSDLFIEHPWTKELLEKYQVRIFSDWSRAEIYAQEWAVGLVRKSEGSKPSADFLIDVDWMNSLNKCEVHKSYACIEDFFSDQEPGHPVGRRIYLDDVRETPPGWIRVYWPKQLIEHLKSGMVTQVSLDHDLGETTMNGAQAPDGNDVIKYIEEQVHTTGFQPPIMVVHSGNTTAAPRMELGIEAIWRAFLSRWDGIA